MQYIVIEDQGYEGNSLSWFDNRADADAYLVSRKQYADDMTLVEYTQCFDVRVAIQCYEDKLEAARERALAKLSDEDIAVLGLTKA